MVKISQQVCVHQPVESLYSFSRSHSKYRCNWNMYDPDNTKVLTSSSLPDIINQIKEIVDKIKEIMNDIKEITKNIKDRLQTKKDPKGRLDDNEGKWKNKRIRKMNKMKL